VRQELLSEKGIVASLRRLSVRLRPIASNFWPARFETPSGKQLQIDFGERLVGIGGRKVKVFLSPHSATRAGAMFAHFATSARRAGSTGWRARV
jgi:hypothetical protein